jgi:hypothetical protein
LRSDWWKAIGIAVGAGLIYTFISPTQAAPQSQPTQTPQNQSAPGGGSVVLGPASGGTPTTETPTNNTGNYAVYTSNGTLLSYATTLSTAQYSADAVGAGTYVIGPYSSSIIYTSNVTLTASVTSNYYTTLAEGATPSPLGPPWVILPGGATWNTTTGAFA